MTKKELYRRLRKLRNEMAELREKPYDTWVLFYQIRGEAYDIIDELNRRGMTKTDMRHTAPWYRQEELTEEYLKKLTGF